MIDSAAYYRLMNFKKETLVRFMLEQYGEEIDFKKLESFGWERTTGKLNNQIESLQKTLNKVAEKGYDAKSNEYKKVQAKLKQKEFLLKWAQKKSKGQPI